MVDTISASYFVGTGVNLMSHFSSIIYPPCTLHYPQVSFCTNQLKQMKSNLNILYAVCDGRLVPPLRGHPMNPHVSMKPHPARKHLNGRAIEN